jgi:threonine/homoserine/homoserine lactone efflux protein
MTADWYQAAGLAGLAAASFVVALSGALMPGPLLAAAIREGARQGHRAGPLLTLGHGLLEAAAVALIYVFIDRARFLERPAPFATVAFVGGLMLLAMGLLMLAGLRKVRATDLGSTRSGKRDPVTGRLAVARAILSGATVSLSNPYWSAWWVGVGLACIAVIANDLRLGWLGLAVFFGGHISADLVWYWLVTFTVSRGRRLLGDRGHRVLVAACALFLIGFAGLFLWRGAERLGWLRPEAQPEAAQAEPQRS